MYELESGHLLRSEKSINPAFDFVKQEAGMLFRGRPVLYKFEFFFRYSTAAPTHFAVKYLINSLGFSQEEAISASSKVPRTNSFKNPDLFVNFLKQTGFNDTQIKILVYKSPNLLFFDVEKNIKPKLQCLSELGLSGSDLVKVLLRDRAYFQRGLDTSIKPLLSCLKGVLGSDENVAKVIKKNGWLIAYNSRATMEANLNLLRSFGCSNDKIKSSVLRTPGILRSGTKKLEEMLHRVEKEFGVSPDSARFLQIVGVLSHLSHQNIDTKFGVFKSFGWSDTNIFTMLQKQPECVSLSDSRIQTALTFLMKEVRYNSTYIASCPKLLASSLEKRLIPRYEMWKLINEKNLIKRRHKFSTVATWPESKFLEKYVLPIKAELPDLYDLYIKKIEK